MARRANGAGAAARAGSRVIGQPDYLLDVSRLIWRTWMGKLPTGIDRACLSYVQHFHGCSRAVVQRGGLTWVLRRTQSRELFDLLLSPGPDVRRRLLILLARTLWQGTEGARDVAGRIYLNVGHTGLDRAGHGRWVVKSGVRAVYYVHDLIPITHPEFAREGQPERHRKRMLSVLRHADGVIGNSEDSLRALEAFARQEGYPMPRSLCAPLAAATPPEESAEPPMAGPYFLMLGTIEGRKNHAMLLDIWARMAADGEGGVPKLIIIGQRGWCAHDVFARLDQDATLRRHVVELGRCDDAQLNAWLVHARALLFPSFVEGQGLPLVEALARRTAVIASDLDVFRETGGDVPDYLSPHDPDAWIAAIRDYAREGSERRAAQRARMEGFRPVTWDGHFARVEAWLGGLPPRRDGVHS